MKFSNVFRAACLAVPMVVLTACGGGGGDSFVDAGMKAVTFDADTGTGFVGKGDVQLAFGWNNKQLQDNAAGVRFSVSATSTVETTWTCDKDTGPQTNERNNTITTTTQGVLASVTRDRNQVTGFTLLNYDGTPSETKEREGPEVGSCPTGWTAIDLVSTPGGSTSGGLTATFNGQAVAL